MAEVFGNMANPGLDNQLQAIALGANLANQRRQAELARQQLNMQTASQLLRNRQMDMQLRAQEFEMSQAIREQDAQMRDMPKFQMFQNSVAEYLNDPSGQVPFPSMPQLESRSLAVTASQTMQGLDQYSARARQAKALAESQKLQADIQTQELDQLNTMVSDLAKRGVQVPTGYAGVQNGQIVINPDAANVIRSEYSRVLGEEAARKEFSQTVSIARTGGIGEDEAQQMLNEGSITPDQYTQLAQVIQQSQMGATKVERSAPYGIKILERRGVIKNENDRDKAWFDLTTGGNLIFGSTKEQSNFNSALSGSEALGEVATTIEKLNDRLGTDAVRQFIGPVNQPVEKVRQRLRGVRGKGKISDKDAQEIVGILNAIEIVIGDYRNEKYGASLTDSEIKALERLTSNQSNANYLDVIDAFKNSLGAGVTRYLKKYRFNPSLEEWIWEKYKPSDGEKTDTSTGQRVPVPGQPVPDPGQRVPDPGQPTNGWPRTPGGIPYRVKPTSKEQ